MRSLSSVYKSRSFITKNERVAIPDAVFPDEEPPLSPRTDDVSVSEALEIGTEVLSETKDTALRPELSVEKTEQPKIEAGLEETPAEPPAPEIQIQIPPVSKELIGEFYSKELQELAEDTAKQAYYDALNKRKVELRDCISGVQTMMDELILAQQKFVEDYTSELKYMAVDIAEKIILEKIDKDDKILQRLVMQTVANVKNADWLNVEVSERLVSLMDSINEEFAKPEYNGKAHVFPVAGTDGVCRVVTNEGAVVSSIEVQADNLRRTFRDLDQQDQNRQS